MARVAAQDCGGKGGKSTKSGSKTREGADVTAAQHAAHGKGGKKKK